MRRRLLAQRVYRKGMTAEEYVEAHRAVERAAYERWREADAATLFRQLDRSLESERRTT